MGIKFEKKAKGAGEAVSEAKAETPATEQEMVTDPNTGALVPKEETPFSDSVPAKEKVEKPAKTKKPTKKQLAEMAAEAEAEQQAEQALSGPVDPDEPPMVDENDTPTGDAYLAGITAKTAAGVVAKIEETSPGVVKVEHVQPIANVDLPTVKGHPPTNEQIAVGPIVVKHEGMANVGVNVARTIGLPNYSNVKFGVSLFMPSGTDPEALQKTYEFIESWVDTKMAELSKPFDEE